MARLGYSRDSNQIAVGVVRGPKYVLSPFSGIGDRRCHEREKKVTTQIDRDVLADNHLLAKDEGCQLQAIVEEALVALLEERRQARPTGMPRRRIRRVIYVFLTSMKAVSINRDLWRRERCSRFGPA